MRSFVLLLGALLAAVSPASAVTIVFSGNFSFDDDAVIWGYHVDNTGPVTVSTTSFPGGGFSPILTLFDSTGAFQFDNIGYSTNSDATLTWNSIGGEDYIVTLTEYDNNALGPNISDGFTRDGQGNFTAEPPFNPSVPGGSFLLPGPEQRTSYYSVDFTSADPTLEVIPEPSSAAMALSGGLMLAGLLAHRRRRSRLNRAG